MYFLYINTYRYEIGFYSILIDLFNFNKRLNRIFSDSIFNKV